ncbi:MAG: hypothetical protein ACREBG_08485 [Pyrinomonadaceae bacterium]
MDPGIQDNKGPLNYGTASGSDRMLPLNVMSCVLIRELAWLKQPIHENHKSEHKNSVSDISWNFVDRSCLHLSHGQKVKKNEIRTLSIAAQLER